MCPSCSWDRHNVSLGGKEKVFSISVHISHFLLFRPGLCCLLLGGSVSFSHLIELGRLERFNMAFLIANHMHAWGFEFAGVDTVFI